MPQGKPVGIYGWPKRHMRYGTRIFTVSGHGLNLNGSPKNIPAMQWLVAKLDSFHINPSPVSPVEAAFYILACYCPDNKVLGYVMDTLMLCYRRSDSKGMMMCARIHSVVNRKEEYPHLNGLYNNFGRFLFERIFPFPRTSLERRQFHDREWIFREAERYLPDFKASGFREMVLARVTAQMTGEELAKRCHMSNTTFRAHFKATFGTTVSNWLRERKKSRIMDMLCSTDMPIQKISERNGFRNESTFSEYCRRKFWCSTNGNQEKHKSDKKLK